ncbi:BglG family transcription antiterminator [Paenibacillus sp. J2TS4]|uniref:BglG family transcription antiterminator n=1 Tax=Paenibacillus sp. J2TS4 TaxID=2807194 RepID=UPI001B2968A3|nr:BglG family transcription antiterminator [Paenibacillus sp. J2TS4]GIP33837.1 transcriptional antiterminator [Paenibacillus sp. J2TS4]
MAIILDERSTSILAYLQETDNYVPIQELMDNFHISKRTVYYDMDKINHWLSSHHLAPVEYVRGAGFLLPTESRAKLPVLAQSVQPSQYYLSRNERKALLGIHLINRTEPMFLQDMERLLDVSRGTAHAELTGLREELARYGLSVKFNRKQGYTIQGNEKDQRTALFHYLSDLLAHISWKDFVPQIQGLINANLYRAQFPAFRQEPLSSIYDIITSGERTIGMELTDETIFHLAARLIMCSNRLIQGKQVEMDEDEMAALSQTLQYKAATQISQELGRLYEVTFPEAEVCYITVLLLTAKVNKLEQKSNDEETRRIRQATSEMVDTFEQLGCVYFLQREELENQLFLHVKSAFYRIKYGLQIENPLASTIIDKYREVFELTRQSVEPLEKLLGQPIDDQEIAYLSMHFGGWLRREQVEPARRKSAVIVCVNGVSVSRMLQIQLKRLFPAIDFVEVLSLREYEKYTGWVDFIFSTVPLTGSKVPVFIVSGILTDQEKSQLLHQIDPLLGGRRRREGTGPSAQSIVELVKKHTPVANEAALLEDIQRYLTAMRYQPLQDSKPTLQQLLPSSRIVIREEQTDWRTAISLAAAPLLEEGTIVHGYIRAMIDKVMEYGPYIVIAPGLAIAHAKPEDGVVRTSMSLLSIREGAAFGDDPKHIVRLLFVIASQDGESHLKALTQLTDMLREEANRTRLEQTNDKDEIIQMIRQYSTTS